MSDLPIYHVDSMVLLPKNPAEVRLSSKVISGATKKYFLRVSIPTLGECLLKILTDENFKNDQINMGRGRYENNAIHLLKGLIEDGPIEMCKPCESHLHIGDIKKVDNFLENDHTDLLILSTAITDKAKGLITSDSKMLRSNKLMEFLSDKHNFNILDVRNAPNFNI